jgi:hypothetical protein
MDTPDLRFIVCARCRARLTYANRVDDDLVRFKPTGRLE